MSRIAVTPQLMTAIFQGFKALYLKGFEAQEALYAAIAMTVPSKTSKEIYGWLGQSTGFREWLGDRVVQALTTHDFSIANKHFENTVGVNRNQIEDDEFGVLSPVFEQLGMDAKSHPNVVIFDLLKTGRVTKCYDGKPFFATDHPTTDSKGKVIAQSNLTTEAGGKPTWYLFDTSKAIKPIIWQVRKPYDFVRKDQPTDDIVFFNNQAVYGADARVNAGFALWQLAHACDKDLTAANFKAVRQAMRGLKGDNGRPLTIKPMELHIPTSLESAAELVFAKATINGGVQNELFREDKVVVNAYRDCSEYPAAPV